MQCLLLPQITEVHVHLTRPADHSVPDTVLSAFIMISLYSAPGLSALSGKNEVVPYGPFQLQHLRLGEFY